jgi:hypothetical protein
MSRIIKVRSSLVQLLRQQLPTLVTLLSVGLMASLRAPAARADTVPDVRIAVTEPVAAEAGLETALFTVTRAGATSTPLKVVYDVIGAAKAGKDYVATEGSVTIPAGATSAPITITPLDDTTVEGTEDVTILLRADSAYRVVPSGSATAMIADDDTPAQLVRFAIDDPGATEAGASTGRFTIMRDGSTAAPLTVAYTVSGSAIAGKDYVPLAGSVTIPAGEASATIILTPIDDRVVEQTEIVVLTIASNAGYKRENPSSATVTIDDDDTRSSPPSAAPTPSPVQNVYIPLVSNS